MKLLRTAGISIGCGMVAAVVMVKLSDAMLLAVGLSMILNSLNSSIEG